MITGLNQVCLTTDTALVKPPEKSQTAQARPMEIKGGAVPVGNSKKVNAIHQKMALSVDIRDKYFLINFINIALAVIALITWDQLV